MQLWGKENEKDKLPKIILHGLRHTSATLLIAENLDIVAVAGRLGHSDTGTAVNIYAHALREPKIYLNAVSIGTFVLSGIMKGIN